MANLHKTEETPLVGERLDCVLTGLGGRCWKGFLFSQTCVFIPDTTATHPPRQKLKTEFSTA